MLSIRPHRLSPSVELSTLGDEVAVGLLPSREEVQDLTRKIVIAGKVIHPENVRRVAQPECVIMKFIYRLDVVVPHFVACDEIVNQVCTEGVIHLLFWYRDLDASRKQRLPE